MTCVTFIPLSGPVVRKLWAKLEASNALDRLSWSNNMLDHMLAAIDLPRSRTYRTSCLRCLQFANVSPPPRLMYCLAQSTFLNATCL